MHGVGGGLLERGETMHRGRGFGPALCVGVHLWSLTSLYTSPIELVLGGDQLSVFREAILWRVGVSEVHRSLGLGSHSVLGCKASLGCQAAIYGRGQDATQVRHDGRAHIGCADPWWIDVDWF